MRPPLGGLGLSSPPAGSAARQLTPRRRSEGAELGQTVKEQAIGKTKGKLKDMMLQALFPDQTGTSVLNPTTGETVSSTSFPDVARNQMFTEGLGPSPGLEWINAPGTSFEGLAEMPAGYGIMNPAAGGFATGLGSGSISGAGSAIGAGAEGGIAAGGAGAIGGEAAGLSAGTVGAGVAIPALALGLVNSLAYGGHKTDISEAAKWDPLGVGGLIGNIGGTKNQNYTRNFFGNLKATNTSIGKSFETLARGLGGATSQEDLAQLVDNFRSQVHDETGIEAYGMPHGPGTEGQQYRRSGPLDIPGLPGVGAKTHGQPTTPVDWGSTRAAALESIQRIARQLPSGGQTTIPSWASVNQPTTTSQFTPPEGYRNIEGSWYGGPENSRLEDLSPYTQDVTTYPEQTYAPAGPAYGGFAGPPIEANPQPPVGLFQPAGMSPTDATMPGTTVPGQGVADIATSTMPASPGFLAGRPTSKKEVDESIRLHEGGVVPGQPGQEVDTTLEAGETVLPTGFNKMGHKGGNPLSRLKSLTISFAHDDDDRKRRR